MDHVFATAVPELKCPVDAPGETGPVALGKDQEVRAVHEKHLGRGLRSMADAALPDTTTTDAEVTPPHPPVGAPAPAPKRAC